MTKKRVFDSDVLKNVLKFQIFSVLKIKISCAQACYYFCYYSLHFCQITLLLVTLACVSGRRLGSAVSLLSHVLRQLCTWNLAVRFTKCLCVFQCVCVCGWIIPVDAICSKLCVFIVRSLTHFLALWPARQLYMYSLIFSRCSSVWLVCETTDNCRICQPTSFLALCSIIMYVETFPCLLRCWLSSINNICGRKDMSWWHWATSLFDLT